jgi:RNA methyltransferase, TrmH family
MPHFSKRDPLRRPAPRPEPVSGEFVAPSGAPRPRGSASGQVDRPPVAATPAHHLPGSRSGPTRQDELKVCGLAAVRARFARDPASIQRLFFDYATGRQIGVMCKVLAAAKKVYRCVEPPELEKIAGSVHHGGIVAVVTPPALRAPTAADLAAWAKRGEALLVLDRIGNAHNLGAIARTAAFFGVPRIVLPDQPGAARPGESAYRVAEGGLEAVEVFLVPAIAPFARELAAAGFDVVGAATRGGRPDVARRGPKPVALILGNEEHGLAPETAAACARLVTIPGGGAVESLNVSVAAAVLLWELVARRVQ